MGKGCCRYRIGAAAERSARRIVVVSPVRAGGIAYDSSSLAR